MSENQAYGSIKISDEVICVIVGIAVAETPGVLLPQASGASEWIGKRKMPKYIRANVTEEGVNVAVSIGIEYGHRVRDVAEQVQTAVKTAVEDMTGMQVVSVDVEVECVVMPKTEQAVMEKTE